MTLTKARREPQPLDDNSLQELALLYVGKYATTRAKLCHYLDKKLRARGWQGSNEPQLEALADRLAERGYIDEVAYALSKSRSLSARGYGRRRLADRLRADGIEASDSAEANEHATNMVVAAALRFAERRHLGPYAATAADSRQRQKWIAAMVRAGHDFQLARAIAMLSPGDAIDLNSLQEAAE